MIINAANLNAHLESDGVVQVTTYLKSTLYTKKHAGWFSTNDKGELFVRHGRGKVCIGQAGRLLCSVRTGRYEESK